MINLTKVQPYECLFDKFTKVEWNISNGWQHKMNTFLQILAGGIEYPHTQNRPPLDEN